MESQSGTLQSPFSSAGARRQGSALRFSPTAVRRSCAVSHAKLKMSCGGSALSMECRRAAPVTGSSCPLRRRRPGRSESGVRIDREGWNGLETVTPVTLALTHRQGGTVLDRLLGQVRPARGNVNVCVHDRISLPASIQETQWSASNVVMRNSLSDLPSMLCFSLD